jgi:hypothetical protein
MAGAGADGRGFEGLGVFYLGRRFDAESGRSGEEPLLYDARDLTTHAVIVGATGSGKTGLGVALLEEAALDGIPALAIDPKGDLGNLLLTFPELRADDFRPWIDDEEAARGGASPDELARRTAQRWREGLAAWGQDGARIARLRAAAEVRLYTPGSLAGLPLRALRSLDAPPPALLEDPDALRERVVAAASALLALLGIEADPLRSREHVLLSTLLEDAWRAGRSVELADLVRSVESPPFAKVGALDLESFFPAAQRARLAADLNQLLAAPGFAAWREGEPLDVARLLHAPDGRPRLSILSIAHLSDAERMFFVTLLLGEVVAWMRTRPGTGSLRALLFMDEVFGFFPPVASPPAKAPMLTLLKQARAHGLGVVLATQNPADLDYKGLSNAGTWFLGRLSTQRDRERVSEGLAGSVAATGEPVERLLGDLAQRVFLMRNVHEDAPLLFQTRWTLSWLRGPLTRQEIRRLVAEAGPGAPPAREPDPVPAGPAAGVAPALPAEAAPAFLPTADAGPFLLRPVLLGTARIRYADRTSDVDAQVEVACVAPLAEQSAAEPWRDARELPGGAPALAASPPAGARFETPPAAASKARGWAGFRDALAAHLARERPLRLQRCAALDLVSRPGESAGEFRVRLRERLHEQRDAALDALRQRYARRIAAAEERVRRAEARVEREEEQRGRARSSTAISVGTTLLGALLGRRRVGVGTLGRAAGALRSADRAAREERDVERAREEHELRGEGLSELNAELERELDAARARFGEEALACEERALQARRSDVEVRQVRLVWTPWRVAADGALEPAFVWPEDR